VNTPLYRLADEVRRAVLDGYLHQRVVLDIEGVRGAVELRRTYRGELIAAPMLCSGGHVALAVLLLDDGRQLAFSSATIRAIDPI
jgi:hypothetical protein